MFWLPTVAKPTNLELFASQWYKTYNNVRFCTGVQGLVHMPKTAGTKSALERSGSDLSRGDYVFLNLFLKRGKVQNVDASEGGRAQ
eukprot:3557414-Rhodomonas_salina.3